MCEPLSVGVSNTFSPQVVFGASQVQKLDSEIVASKLCGQPRVSAAHTDTTTLISTSLATRAQCPDGSSFARHSEEKSGHVLNLSFN